MAAIIFLPLWRPVFRGLSLSLSVGVNFRSPLEKHEFSTAPPSCKWNRLIAPVTESKSFQVCYQTVRQDNADKYPKFQNCVWTFCVSTHRVHDQTSKVQVCHACTSFEGEIVYCCIRIDCRDSNTTSSLGQCWMNPEPGDHATPNREQICVKSRIRTTILRRTNKDRKSCEQ